jgi:hypothetical protein
MSGPTVWAIPSLLCLLASGVALVFAIRRLVTTLRAGFEVTVELAPELRVTLPTAGPKIVYLRAPRFSNVSQLRLSMRSAAGAEIPLTRVLFRLMSSGRDVTQAYAQCELPAGGEYLISASGIPAAARPLALRFGPPNLVPMIACILAVLFSGMLMIGSLVASALLLTGAS